MLWWVHNIIWICQEGDMGGALNTATPQKKLTNTASPNHTRNHSTANNFISQNTAAWKTQTSHTVRFEITATPQIEILFTASRHRKNINTSTPQIPMSPSVRLRTHFHVPWAKFYGNSECRWATCVFRSDELGISKQRWRPEALGNAWESVVLPFLKNHGINWNR